MKDSYPLRRLLTLMCCCAGGLPAGCQPMSEHEVDSEAGLNGGFEVARNGLPVNWNFYSPNTVPDADFGIFLDRETFKEGRQSLMFDVERCAGKGGWHAPGFTNEFAHLDRYRGPSSYRVSLWVKSTGVEYTLSAGPVALKTGDMRILRRDDAEISEWTEYEFTVDVPEQQWLRVQLNVCSPGTFWVDDFRVQAITDSGL